MLLLGLGWVGLATYARYTVFSNYLVSKTLVWCWSCCPTDGDSKVLVTFASSTDYSKLWQYLTAILHVKSKFSIAVWKLKNKEWRQNKETILSYNFKIIFSARTSQGALTMFLHWTKKEQKITTCTYDIYFFFLIIIYSAKYTVIFVIYKYEFITLLNARVVFPWPRLDHFVKHKNTSPVKLFKMHLRCPCTDPAICSIWFMFSILFPFPSFPLIFHNSFLWECNCAPPHLCMHLGHKKEKCRQHWITSRICIPSLTQDFESLQAKAIKSLDIKIIKW